jgi:hypothetical protein
MDDEYIGIEEVQPSRDYEPDIFDRFLDLTNLKNEEDRILFTVYIISLFIRYPTRSTATTWGEISLIKNIKKGFIFCQFDSEPMIAIIDVAEFYESITAEEEDITEVIHCYGIILYRKC